MRPKWNHSIALMPDRDRIDRLSFRNRLQETKTMFHRVNQPGWALTVILGGALLAANSAQAQPQQSQIINEHILAKWTELKLTPAKRASDDVFIRRVFIDIIGRIPTV